MNKVIEIGNIVRKDDLKFTPGSGVAVINFCMAVDRRFVKDKPKESDFINLKAWGKQAELIANWGEKGKKIAIAGRLECRSYDAKDGTKKYITEVVVEEVEILQWPDKDKQQPTGTDGYMPVGADDDGEIPF